MSRSRSTRAIAGAGLAGTAFVRLFSEAMVASAGSRSGRVPALTKYDVLEELGHGGMATVYRAHDKRLARDVAVKVLHPHLRESSEIAHRFSAEAKAVAKLRHPNIVEVFDVSSEEDVEQFLVVELIRGLTLRKTLEKHGALPPEIAAALAMEILAAVEHAHASGVIHRDVKPENVLLEIRSAASSPHPSVPPSDPRKTGVGERVAVKLTDFGIAKLLDAQGVTSTGQVLGSPAHMAPEQIEGGEVDGRADVFGVGVLLYECMVGHLPFEGNNPAQVLRRVLDGIYPSAERERAVVGKIWSSLLDRALARRAEDRYPDAASMREAISAELGRLGFGAGREELEAWMDDPETWREAHDKKLIGRLCELGAASRKTGDAVAAAADYNRALAYTPADPHLLRIVASMHRAEARMRLVRKIVPLVLGSVLLGTGAYAVTRALKPVPIASRGDDGVAPPLVPMPGTFAPPSALSVASTDQAHPPVIPTGPPRPTAYVLVPSAAKAPVKREIRFGSLRPNFGVLLSVDGEAAQEVTPASVLSVDDKTHRLRFSCARDMCEAKSIEVAAGERSETLSVELSIAPATLVVEGEAGHAYTIDGRPTIAVLAGRPTTIPMTAGIDDITVVDAADPQKKRSIRIKSGESASLSFK